MQRVRFGVVSSILLLRWNLAQSNGCAFFFCLLHKPQVAFLVL